MYGKGSNVATLIEYLEQIKKFHSKGLFAGIMEDHPTIPLANKLIKVLSKGDFNNCNFSDKIFSDQLLRQLNVNILKIIELSKFDKRIKQAFLTSSDEIVYQISDLSSVNSDSREICLGIASCKVLIDMELLARIETNRDKIKKERKSKLNRKKRNTKLVKFTSSESEQSRESSPEPSPKLNTNNTSLAGSNTKLPLSKEQSINNQNISTSNVSKNKSPNRIQRILSKTKETLGISSKTKDNELHQSIYLAKKRTVAEQKEREKLIRIKSFNNSMEAIINAGMGYKTSIDFDSFQDKYINIGLAPDTNAKIEQALIESGELLNKLKSCTQKVNYSILSHLFFKFEQKFSRELSMESGSGNEQADDSIFDDIKCRYLEQKRTLSIYNQSETLPFLDHKGLVLIKDKLITIENSIHHLNQRINVHKKFFKKLDKQISLILNRIKWSNCGKECVFYKRKLEILRSRYASVNKDAILDKELFSQLSVRVKNISLNVERIIANNSIIDQSMEFFTALFNRIKLERGQGKGVKSFRKTRTLKLLKNSVLVKLNAMRSADNTIDSAYNVVKMLLTNEFVIAETNMFSCLLCCLSCGMLGSAEQKKSVLQEVSRQTQCFPFFYPPVPRGRLAVDSCMKETFNVDNFSTSYQLT